MCLKQVKKDDDDEANQKQLAKLTNAVMEVLFTLIFTFSVSNSESGQKSKTEWFRFFHWELRFVNKYLNFPRWLPSAQTDWRRERWKLRDFPKFAGRQLGASSPALATCPDACARFQTFLFKRTSQNTSYLKMLSKQKLFQIKYYRGKIFYFVEIRPFDGFCQIDAKF